MLGAAGLGNGSWPVAIALMGGTGLIAAMLRPDRAGYAFAREGDDQSFGGNQEGDGAVLTLACVLLTLGVFGLVVAPGVTPVPGPAPTMPPPRRGKRLGTLLRPSCPSQRAFVVVPVAG